LISKYFGGSLEKLPRRRGTVGFGPPDHTRMVRIRSAWSRSGMRREPSDVKKTGRILLSWIRFYPSDPNQRTRTKSRERLSDHLILAVRLRSNGWSPSPSPDRTQPKLAGPQRRRHGRRGDFPDRPRPSVRLTDATRKVNRGEHGEVVYRACGPLAEAGHGGGRNRDWAQTPARN
jgi:hypothetical protein